MSIIEIGIGNQIKKKEIKPTFNTEKMLPSKVENVISKKEKKIKENNIPTIKNILFTKSAEETKILEKLKKRDIEQTNYQKHLGKEIFEKLGSGLVNQQFINVILSQIGASYFIIGIMNGLKDLFSIFMGLLVQEYLKVRNFKPWEINLAGILLGLSYLSVAFAIFWNSIYTIGFLLVGIGILTAYLGQTYSNTFLKDIKEKPRLGKFPQYGVIIIGISLLIGSYILDNYPISENLFKFGDIFKVPGYVLLLSLAAICFTISSQFMKVLIKPERFEIKTSIGQIVKDYLKEVFINIPFLIKNKIVLIALIASITTGLVQTIGNIYYGLYIYKIFKYMAFGGFINIAMIFIISIFSSLMSTTIARLLSKKYGNLPLLTFGTLMVATQPLTYYLSPNLLAISMATIIGIIGASITGLAIGLLITHALESENRTKYYNTFSLILTLPYLFFVPLGAYFAQAFGLRLLFLVLSLSLLVLVTPMYFILQIKLGNKIA
ncbi:hypothetical protein J4418_00320 [Candidatus Woesearchaeota archaeon]|nr:hypothetical protein [Candidatus Woesearchaeota archaeon]